MLYFQLDIIMNSLCFNIMSYWKWSSNYPPNYIKQITTNQLYIVFETNLEIVTFWKCSYQLPHQFIEGVLQIIPVSIRRKFYGVY